MVDWWKQIITLDTAVVALTATFYKDLTTQHRCSELLFVSWLLFMLSLFAAMTKLWAHLSPRKGAGGRMEKLREVIRKCGGSPITSILAYGCFMAGMLLIVAFVAGNIVFSCWACGTIGMSAMGSLLLLIVLGFVIGKLSNNEPMAIRSVDRPLWARARARELTPRRPSWSRRRRRPEPGATADRASR